VAKGFVRTIWTTNFDGLAARACAAENITCIEVGIDVPQRAALVPRNKDLRVVSLHGDYRYGDLRNAAGKGPFGWPGEAFYFPSQGFDDLIERLRTRAAAK